MANSEDPDQTAAVWAGSALFASLRIVTYDKIQIQNVLIEEHFKWYQQEFPISFKYTYKPLSYPTAG